MKEKKYKKLLLLVVCVSLVLGITLILDACNKKTTSTKQKTFSVKKTNLDENKIITEDHTGNPTKGGKKPSDTGSSKSDVALSAVYTVSGSTKTSSSNYKTSKSDKNTVLVKNSGSLTYTDGTLTKSGDTTSADSSNFYGLNAIFAVTKKSTAVIKNATLTSSSEGSNAIFATGSGAKITVDNVKITTTKNSSRGLDATYGGTIDATNVTISTKGAHCAPIATDRGEGTVTVKKGTVTAQGDGSPCIYSTGKISATDLTGTAKDSQSVVVEGKNSVALSNCNLTGYGKNGIMLYQSTSGDASNGTAALTVKNSSLTSKKSGPMFYVTNTTAKTTLVNTTLKYKGGILVNVAGNNTNNWGKVGYNGGDYTLTGINQSLTGEIKCDNISTMSLVLKKNSTYKGVINKNETAKSLSVTLDATSTWNVTGDSYITILKNVKTDCSNIKSNGHTIYYDASNEASAWLNNKTIKLSGGGVLKPA